LWPPFVEGFLFQWFEEKCRVDDGINEKKKNPSSSLVLSSVYSAIDGADAEKKKKKNETF